MLPPPVVDQLHQRLADARGLLFAMGVLQPDEGGVRVAVDHLVTLGLDQGFGLTHDLMPAHGDRRRQPGIEEAAGAGAQHAVKGVHDDLQRLGERLVTLAFGLIAAVPDLADNLRQAVLLAGEPRPKKALATVGFVRLCHALYQPHRIDQKGANDRRVEALIVQHQHRVIQAGRGVHHIAAGAGLRRHVTEIRGHVARPVHAGKIEMAEGRYRPAVAIHRQTVDRGALEQEGHDRGLMENARHQLAVFQVVGGEGWLIFIEASLNLVHSVPRVIDRLAFPEQLPGYRLKRE